MTPVEIRGYFWHQKTRVLGLSCGVVCVILCLAVLIQYRLVTDGRTTAYTPASIASSNNNKFCSLGVYSGSYDLLKFWEISVSISETVQDRQLQWKINRNHTYVSLSDFRGHFSCLKPFYLPFDRGI